MYKDADRNNTFIKRHKILSSGCDVAIANMTSQQPQQSALGLDKAGPIGSQSWIDEGLMGPYTSLLNFWQLMNSGKRSNHGLHCVPNDESTRFQWLCPNLWPHSQLKIRGPQNNTTKAKGYGKGTCREEEGMTGLGEIRKNSSDSKQNQDIHVWACQRTSLINLQVESDDKNQDKWV